MARKFNGSEKATIASTGFPATSITSVFIRLYCDALNTTPAKACEYGAETTDNGFVIEPSNSASAFKIGMFKAGASDYWLDKFTWPSAAAWHDYLFVFDRAALVNKAWVDVVPQTMVTHFHQGTSYGNFTANAQMVFAVNYGGSAEFLAGRMQDFAIWPGVALGLGEAAALRNASPLSVRPDRLQTYVPWPGFPGSTNREPVYGRNGVPVANLLTLSGSSGVAGPYGYQPFVRRRRKAVFA